MNPKLAGAGLLSGVLISATAVTIALRPGPVDTRCMRRPADVSVQQCARWCNCEAPGRCLGACEPVAGVVMPPGTWIDHGGCEPVACGDGGTK